MGRYLRQLWMQVCAIGTQAAVASAVSVVGWGGVCGGGLQDAPSVIRLSQQSSQCFILLPVDYRGLWQNITEAGN